MEMEKVGAMEENWFNITTVTAVWGACLATVHGASSLIRVLIDHPKVTVDTSMTSSTDVGNTVIIYNHSPRRINILGWNIYYLKGWFKKKSGDIISTFEDGELMALGIEPYNSRRVDFKNQYHFSGSITKGDLYIELHIAGRKSPVVLKL